MADVEGARALTASRGPLRVVGPLRIADRDVFVRTNDEEFAEIADGVFADLALAEAPTPATELVVFETVRHTAPTVHWSVHRDGEPCELDLRPDAVLVHQQWEFNRLAIESQPCAIHAAAVQIGTGGVLLAGPSHSGKTTLAGWLVARHGAGFVADEVAAIDGRLRVRPFPRPLGVRSDSPLTGVAACGDPEMGEPFERLVPVSQFGGVVATEPVPVRMMVLPRYGPDELVTARRLSESDALEALAVLTPGVVHHGRPVFERLSRLVAAIPTFEIGYADVEAAAVVVESEFRRLGER